MESIKVFNIFLVVVALALVFNLINPTENIVGKAHVTMLDDIDGCLFINGDEQHEIRTGECCLAIQRQLTCEKSPALGYTHRCYTSPVSSMFYLVNEATIEYCADEGYHASVT